MKNFNDFVLNYTPNAVVAENNPYSNAGKCYSADNEHYNGYYWFYESSDFIIDIHDFYIKCDFVENNIPDMSSYMFLSSSYIISGSGEWLDPYQSVEPSSVFIMNLQDPFKRYLLHGNSRFFVVGMKFKDRMIENHLVNKMDLKRSDVPKIFIDTQKDVTRLLARISDDIINCKMDGLSAELFFEAKAKEWLSITIDAYKKHNLNDDISNIDAKSIESVAKYIEDHYAFDIPQSLLEKIAAMSGTKLKETFKQKYNMNITEFTQRKRMNIAENLLLTTDMDIRDIAKSVGYNSPSRFTTLFKRYKGIYPKDIHKKV